MTPIEREIRQYLSESFLFGKEGDTLPANESLLDMGVIDSTGVLEIAGFMEEHFNVNVVDDDFLPENFETIEGMVSFVERKSRADPKEKLRVA